MTQPTVAGNRRFGIAFKDHRAGCTVSPQDFTCLAMNQIVEVKLSENGMGTMLATRVEFIENASREAIKGTINSVDSPKQFHMVVFREAPSVNGVSEGAPVAVTIAPNAVLQIGREELGEDGGFSMSGFSFASSADSSWVRMCRFVRAW